MKNRIQILLLVMAFLASACSEVGKTYRIGVSQCSDDAWRSKMNTEILREAMFYDGVDVEFRNAGDNSLRQTEDIEYFMEQGVDLLIVAPNEAAAITPAIEKVYDAGIPVVVVDRKTYSDKYTAFLGGDNLQIGSDVGYYIAKIMDGRGTVIELAGLKGASPAQLRHEGFAFALQNYPGIDVKTFYADWTPESAFRIMDSLLLAGIRPDVIFAHNDRMAIAASAAAASGGGR